MCHEASSGMRTAAAPADSVLDMGEYMPAAVCRRGHVDVIDASLKAPSSHCSTCGAEVLTGCSSCGHRIRGRYRVPGVIGGGSYSPPSFCDGCGSPFPWAGRKARVYQLQNLLDEEELDSAAELVVREQLQALLDPDLDDADQARRWKRVKAAAPGFLDRAATQPIVQSLLSAWLKQELHLPPT